MQQNSAENPGSTQLGGSNNPLNATNFHSYVIAH